MLEGREIAIWYEADADRLWLERESALQGSWFITYVSTDETPRPSMTARYLPLPELAGLTKICDLDI